MFVCAQHSSENGGISPLDDGLPDFYTKRVLPDRWEFIYYYPFLKTLPWMYMCLSNSSYIIFFKSIYNVLILS